MSVGNLKTNGNKGNNFPYQIASLQLLDQILQAILAGGGGGGACPCPSNAQESTLLQVLGALQNGQEFEQALVMDLGGSGCPGNCPTYIQIRIWDTVNHVFLPPVYYDASGAVVVPVGPLQFLNPQFVLENILTQVTSINSNIPAAAVRNTTLLRTSAAGTILIGARSVTIANTGAANGLALGSTVKPGESFTWSAGENDTLNAISYDGTGTELVITTVR